MEMQYYSMHNSIQKTQLPSLTPNHSEQISFSHNYNELVAGINRIRYIKKKQVKNHNMMTDHLTHMLKQLQKQQESVCTPKINIQLPKSKSQPLPKNNGNTVFKYNLKEHSPYKKKNMKFFVRESHVPDEKDPNNETRKENTEIKKIREVHRENRESYSNFAQSKPQTRQEKKRLLIAKKKQNYQEMRELRNKRQERKKQQYQEKLNEAKERRVKAIINRQQGRKRQEDHYYRYIDTIKAEKDAEKQKKIKIHEQKCKELFQIQKKEEEELAQYEKSIILEEELKQFLEKASNKGSREALVTDDTFF